MTKALNVAEPAFRTPRPVAGQDIRSLPLNPREAFLLSRIDGSVTVADLAALTGFDQSTVSASVERLAALGAIEFDDPDEASQRPSHEQIGAHVKPPATGTGVSQTHFRSPVQEPRETDEVVDLEPDRRRKVLELFARLSELDYYGLLGIVEGADKKEIKRAYYALAPNYHPDKFYGKKLGSFKAKMEAIFGQLTFAYETLTSVERRAEYDAYLATQKQTRSMEELLGGTLTTEQLPPSTPTPQPPLVITPTPPGGPNSVGTMPTPSSQAKDDRARREALARKLGGTRSSVPPTEGRISAAPTSSQASIQAAAKELKRRHDVIAGDSRRSQARRYVDAANASMKTNPAAAANALRLALTMDPDNAQIAAAHREAAKAAAVALADGYLKQGDYESRNNQWPEAARSYVRAAAGKPNDASVMRRTAHALLKSGGDMHLAVDFAKKAIAIAPKHIEPRLTLMEVYIAAGLPLAAKRELELAREIAPQDDRMIELTKRLK